MDGSAKDVCRVAKFHQRPLELAVVRSDNDFMIRSRDGAVEIAFFQIPEAQR
jgi:hypothetical protein